MYHFWRFCVTIANHFPKTSLIEAPYWCFSVEVHAKDYISIKKIFKTLGLMQGNSRAFEEMDQFSYSHKQVSCV